MDFDTMYEEIDAIAELIYRVIKTIDLDTGELFLRAMRNESD